MNARLICRKEGESDLKFPDAEEAITTGGARVREVIAKDEHLRWPNARRQRPISHLKVRPAVDSLETCDLGCAEIRDTTMQRLFIPTGISLRASVL